MKYLESNLGLRLALITSLILIPLLIASFLWFDSRSEKLMIEEQEARATQVAESLVASLSSIMLSGNANIAHDWLNRIASVSGIESAKIFRSNGIQAFQDLSTQNKVNAYIGNQRFSRSETSKPERISPEVKDSFQKAIGGQVLFNRSNDNKQLNYIYPIKLETTCIACHGYDANPVRGVLILGMSIDAGQAIISETERGMIKILIFILTIMGTSIWLLIRWQVLKPINTIAQAASNIRLGDLTSKIELHRNDELGMVANTLNRLVSKLKDTIDHEATQRQHQEAITDAVISLGQDVTSISLFKHISKICMKITNAPYAMISYNEMGEKQFIALGFSPEIEANIAQHPEGKGLLGLLWNEGHTLRLDSIDSHPKSSGFPQGHPPMGPFLGSPMQFEGQILGVIYLSKAPGDLPFSDDDEKALITLASACAIALSNTQNFERVKETNDALEERVTERTFALDKANKQLKTHELELELINEELVSANKAKDQFLANTSHELRTPLNAIIGFSELLTNPRAGELNTKQQRYVEHVHNSGKRLLTIINDLLDISKIEAGMMEIHEITFNPTELSRQLLAELTPLAKSKNIKLNLIESIDSNLIIQSDRDKLHQVMVNLVGNAIKFTPEGGHIEVDLALERNKQQAGEANLSCYIKDNGIGIPVEDQDRIFMPFTQSYGGLDRAHGGTGLGLSLAKSMIQLLGGNIRLQSELDQGSTFFIDLPVIVSQSSPVKESEQNLNQLANTLEKPPAPTEEVFPNTGPQPLIMIVDENARRAKYAAEMFISEGYQVTHAEMYNIESIISKTLPLLIILGVPDDTEDIYDHILQLKGSDASNRTPTILMAGDDKEPIFSTGGTIGQISKGISRNDLLEMVSHYGMYPKTPVPPTLLIIDDDPSVREYLKEILAPQGYHILLASNGSEGILLAIEREPDLIILDLMMPGITGFEVVDKLRQHPVACDIPVVIFTAKDLSREEALQLGQDVERILIKGISKSSDVLNQIHKLELLYPVQAKLIDVKLGCFNFRYMQRRLDNEVARVIRYSHHFSLIAWEMDGFEQYCQTHGKRWGTAALKATVSTAVSIIRKGDVLARLDDHSFILLLPGITPEGTNHVAEKIRLRISHQHLPLPDNETGKLTASIGVVLSNEKEPDSSELLTIVKQRLTIAQAEGGNRSVMED